MNFNKEIIKELIASSEVDIALTKLNEMCKKGHFLNEAIILKQRFTSIKKREIKGLVSESNRSRQVNEICDDVLVLVDLIDEALSNKAQNIDSYRVVFAASEGHARWDYYNYVRIFELFFNLNVEYKDIKTYEHLRIKNIVNEFGTVNAIEDWRIKKTPTRYMTDIQEGILVNWYMKNILERIIKKTPIIDISNFHNNKKKLKEILCPNSFITCQLGFYFSDVKEEKSEFWNIRMANYQNNVIKIQFTYDPWYCTSSSSAFTSLRSHSIITPILFIKGIKEENGVLNIEVSCLAMGYAFHEMQLKRFKRYNRE